MALGSSYLSNDLAFTSITLTGTVPAEDPQAGTRTYSPSQIHPCFFYADYSPGFGETNDPGRILFLEEEPMSMKTETFDANPNWDGRNNRATDPSPRQIVQNFGFSATQMRWTGGRNWRLHHAGRRAGILWKSHYTRVVQRSTFRFGRPERSSGWGTYADWFL
jgi:hypothetical protein